MPVALSALLRRFVSCWFAPLAVLAALPAQAQDDYGDPSGKTLTVAADARLVAADGEASWLNGGLGKTRFGPRDGRRDRFVVEGHPIEGDVVWQPHLGWSVDATLAATAQRGQDHPVNLSEAYLSIRRDPQGDFRGSARIGLLWPPVSLEHSGPEWQVTDTVTPSAINSWIGEEVKVAAVEATGRWQLGAHRVAVTGAVFAFGDTAGTLLAFRGWALHDEKATAFGAQPLPPLDQFMQHAQAPETYPVIELDHRPGFYAKFAWSPPAPIKLHVFYYDNRGNPEAVRPSLQWGWSTQFGEAGAVLDAAPGWRLKTQAMLGRTRMGFPRGGTIWVDTWFRSAYLLATHTIGHGSISARAEAFGTTADGSVLGPDEGERGWAITAAAKRSIGAHLTLVGEILHVESNRGARTRIGLSPFQPQTVAQLALRARL